MPMTDPGPIVPGPKQPRSINWQALIALAMVLTSSALVIHAFLNLSPGMQDKILEHWPLIAPMITAGVGTLWSFLLGPILHIKDKDKP